MFPVAGLDCMGLDWTGLDWTGLDWTDWLVGWLVVILFVVYANVM